MSVLSAREGYRIWAPQYDAETAVSFLEDETVRRLGVDTLGRTLLDVGCGTMRRSCDSGATLAIGIDLSPEMLGAARAGIPVVAGDVRALPFAGASFDVVWCRLMIGHVRDVAACYRELARVCRVGGVLVVSDIAQDAVAAGHRRTFRDTAGAVHEVEHFVHPLDRVTRVVDESFLTLEQRIDGVVGPTIERFYRLAGRSAAYETQCGLPLVTAASWRKLVRST